MGTQTVGSGGKMGKKDRDEKVQVQAEVTRVHGKNSRGEPHTVTVTGNSIEDVADKLNLISRGGNNEIENIRVVEED
jgi:hypothetical protein